MGPALAMGPWFRCQFFLIEIPDVTCPRDSLVPEINESLVPCHPSKWSRRKDILCRFNCSLFWYVTSQWVPGNARWNGWAECDVEWREKMRCGLIWWYADAWCPVKKKQKIQQTKTSNSFKFVRNKNARKMTMTPSPPGVLGFQVWELSIFWRSQGNRLWVSWRIGWT